MAGLHQRSASGTIGEKRIMVAFHRFRGPVCHPCGPLHQCRRTAAGAATDSPRSATAGPTPPPSFSVGVSGSTPAVATTLRPHSTSVVPELRSPGNSTVESPSSGPRPAPVIPLAATNRTTAKNVATVAVPAHLPRARHSIARSGSGRLRLLPIIDRHRSEEQRARPRRGMPSVGVTESRRSPCGL